MEGGGLEWRVYLSQLLGGGEKSGEWETEVGHGLHEVGSAVSEERLHEASVEVVPLPSHQRLVEWVRALCNLSNLHRHSRDQTKETGTSSYREGSSSLFSSHEA